LLSIPSNAVGGVIDEDFGRLLNAPVSALGGVTIASHSRAHEREADERGLKLAAATGYDPAALATILTRMESTLALVAPKSAQREPSFFDTHPTTSSRAQDIEKVVSAVRRANPAAVATNRADFLRRFDGLVLGANPAHGVFDGARFIHPHLRFTLQFPTDWKLVNKPRAVAAIKRDGHAAMILGIVGQGNDPEVPTRAFIEKLRKEARIEPTRAERAPAGAWPAFVVSMTDTTGGSRSEMHFLWAAHEGRIYQLIGLGSPQDLQVIRTFALTLREATSAELNAVTIRRLHLATARASESLEELSSRVGNVWSLDLIALVNDLPRQAFLKLEEGQLVKIAKSEPYFTKGQYASDRPLR
jgi:predicted Zn-dependent protease